MIYTSIVYLLFYFLFFIFDTLKSSKNSGQSMKITDAFSQVINLRILKKQKLMNKIMHDVRDIKRSETESESNCQIIRFDSVELNRIEQNQILLD